MKNGFYREEIVSTINRNDIESLLINGGQNSISAKMPLFSECIPQ